MPEAKPAERVGDFEFLDLLAVGGMGQLWRVRHVKLDAIYVAKVLRPDLRSDPEFAASCARRASSPGSATPTSSRCSASMKNTCSTSWSMWRAPTSTA